VALVNTDVYGCDTMSDQLSARDWLDQGLKTLAERGFTALKAEPLAKALGVSRGSFYWHYSDVGAYHAAILKYWREVAAERVIAEIEAASGNGSPLKILLRQAFSARLGLERAVRSWATFDPAAKGAVQAIDRRRLDYIEGQLQALGLASEIAQARAQILYWAFLGHALSDRPPPKARQDVLIEELLRMALGDASGAPVLEAPLKPEKKP
jgi:AcrR family transcriptional regulator